MMLRSLIFATTLASLGVAHAQEQQSPYQAAQAMIARAQLSDVFEPVVDEATIRVRHAASGMVCLFSATNTRAEVVTFSGQPRGDDVGCIRDSEGQNTTLYATRYTPAKSAEQALAETTAGIRNRFADAQPTPALIVVSSEQLPPLYVAHFFITVRGERWITSAIVAQSGSWIYKLRYSAHASDEDAVRRHQLEASGMLTHVLLLADTARPLTPEASQR